MHLKVLKKFCSSFIVLRFQKLAGNSVDLDEAAYNDLPHLDL